MSTYIYIDDTGTPGIRSMSKYSDTDRKTWVALILNQEQNSDIKRQMLECISELKKVSKADEFHFTDIYSGSGKFKDVSPDTRFALFQFVAEIYRLTNFPLLIQTFTKDDLLRNRIIVPKQPVKADGFDLSKTSDMALLFLLVRIKILFKEKNKYRLPASIIIDEGRQKPNTIQKTILLKNISKNGEINYTSSKEDPILQFVDFAAFSINKVNWIMANNKKSDIDIRMLKIFEHANFNFLNISRQKIDLKKNTIEIHDSIMANTYLKNNNLTDIELEELKRIF